MDKRTPVGVWYDREGDFLEVLFERKAGYFRETPDDRVMEKVDKAGRTIGFHTLRVSRAVRPVKVLLTRSRTGP